MGSMGNYKQKQKHRTKIFSHELFSLIFVWILFGILDSMGNFVVLVSFTLFHS
jgi:hypothetical protein